MNKGIEMEINSPDKKAIILVSGGMDSLVLTGMASLEHSELYLLHVKYGQRTERKELECFHKIADHYKVEPSHRLVADLTFLAKIGGSALTDKNIDLKKIDSKQDMIKDETIPSSYVPFRNTIMLSYAVAWAEVVKARKIYIGAVYEDFNGYPDCRPSYYDAMNKLIKEGTKGDLIEVVTPLIHSSKNQIVTKGQELNVPFEFSWSCYSGEDQACGTCASCALRLQAFKSIGINDPIPYLK